MLILQIQHISLKVESLCIYFSLFCVDQLHLSTEALQKNPKKQIWKSQLN